MSLPRRSAPPLVVVLASTGRAAVGPGVSLASGHARPLAAALAGEGFAVRLLEYRRVGDPGGGWPGPMQDALAGIAHLAQLAEEAPLDPGRLVLVDPSAGGHPVLGAGDAQPEDTPVQARTHPAARAGAILEVLELPDFGHFDRTHPGTDAVPVRPGTLRRLLAPA
jgi:acetyl esterase/lipase